MKTTLLWVIAVLFFMSSARAQTTKESWRPLFNGKDLTGWYTFIKGPGKNADPDKLIQIDDGAIHMYKDTPDGSKAPSGYVSTIEEFSDCRVRLEYKWGQKKFGSKVHGRRDAGLLYFAHGDDGAQGGVWPFSVECQIQENDTGDIYAVGTQVTTTADLSNPQTPQFKEPSDGGTPYTTHQAPHVNDRVARSAMAEKDGWNTVEVILHGDSAVHIINGVINNRLTHAMRQPPTGDGPWISLSKGRLVLQAEGAEVYYRNIEVAPLEAK